MQHDTLSLRRFHDPTDENVEALKQGGEPFLMTGRMRTWEMFDEIEARHTVGEKLKCFVNIAPARQVLYSQLPRRNASFAFGKQLRQRFGERRLGLQELASLIEAADRSRLKRTYYMQAQQLPEWQERLPGLLRLHASTGGTPLFWLGSGGQCTALHNDRYHNAIAVFMGRKKVVLSPPTELRNVYIAPLDRRIQGALTSLADPRTPDFESWPRLRSAFERVRIAEVAPGEILYVPPLWWHLVESSGVNLSANVWIDDVPEAEQLYEPHSLRLLERRIHREPMALRRALADVFSGIVRGNDREGRTGSAHEGPVRAHAEFEAGLLSQIGDARSRRRWTDWIESIVDWLVFQRDGNPFPTLADGEVERMLARRRRELYDAAPPPRGSRRPKPRAAQGVPKAGWANGR